MSSTTTAKSPSRHAHFPSNVGQEPKRSEKILTIRYGKNQMALIRKRLRVEAWLYDSLETLAGERERIEDGGLAGAPANKEIDIDIDQILDVEGDCERRQWLQEKLKTSTAPRETVQVFITEFLDRLKTL